MPASKYGPRGIHDLVNRNSREYNHPIIENTESGCGYLDGPDEEQAGSIPDGRRIEWHRGTLAELARAITDGARARVSCLDPARRLPVGGGVHGALRADLGRLPQPEAHDQGLWPLVRSRGRRQIGSTCERLQVSKGPAHACRPRFPAAVHPAAQAKLSSSPPKSPPSSEPGSTLGSSKLGSAPCGCSSCPLTSYPPCGCSFGPLS
jgi:hypothetical protein